MSRVGRSALIWCATAVLSLSACGRQPVTFNKNVAPIVYANCATCHRPGGDGPFSLLTYSDAAPHAKEIGEQTLTRHMPPWLPEAGDFPIQGVRRLSAVDIETIQRWVKEGAPEGAAKDLPPAPSFPSDWQLGKPGVVLTMPRPYVLKPGGPGSEDVYRNVILRGNLPGDVFVRAVEFRTNGAPVHHALFRLASSAAAESRDGEDGQPGFNGMSSETLQDPEGQFLGWAPGRGPMVSPNGMPWRLERGADVVAELHLIPSKRPANIQPTIALYFSVVPPSRAPVTAMMVSKLIDIPAGDANFVVTERHHLPVEVQLVGLFPHAHYLGKEMLVTATSPGGTPKTLLHIKRWSFHWQQDYRFVTPVDLPKGTVIEMRYTYDNSAGNGENPSDPPVRVRVGNRSADEMANLGLQFLTISPADTGALLASFYQKNLIGNIAAGEARIRETPNSASDRVLLGGSYVQAGRFAEAVPHLQAALRLEPRNAIAESYLGGAYQGLGELARALSHFMRSAQLAPRDSRAQLNLAEAFERAGRRADAVAAYRKVIALDGAVFDAHAKLGELLYSMGRVTDALTHLRRAAAIRPNSADAESDLGGALAAAGLKDEAARHLRRALALEPNHAAARQNLARLLNGRH